jgi:hypothetical protein
MHVSLLTVRRQTFQVKLLVLHVFIFNFVHKGLLTWCHSSLRPPLPPSLGLHLHPSGKQRDYTGNNLENFRLHNREGVRHVLMKESFPVNTWFVRLYSLISFYSWFYCIVTPEEILNHLQDVAHRSKKNTMIECLAVLLRKLISVGIVNFVSLHIYMFIRVFLISVHFIFSNKSSFVFRSGGPRFEISPQTCCPEKIYYYFLQGL